MNKKIIFSAGGTGGHILPAINLMKDFFEKGYEVILITDKRGNSFVSKNSKFKIYELTASTPTNKNFLRKILSLIMIFYSILKSIIILKREKANLIIGFGGYISFPASFASKFLNLPLFIYEPNMVIGRANKYLLPFARKIFLSKIIKSDLLEKYRNKVEIVGSIINKNIVNHLNFKKKGNINNFSILVLGGSQGAEIFGKIIPSVVSILKDKGYTIQINQQCVKYQKNLLKDYYKKKNIKSYVFEFDKNILNLILSSDLAISRCGASATAELAYTLTPFIGVPLPASIDNHQYLNAKFYKDAGFCWLLEENNFNKENLLKLIIEIMKNKKKIEDKFDSMKKNYNINAYRAIEGKIKEII